MNAIVTGGAGFIGSALVHLLMREKDWKVTVVDKLSYAGNPDNLAEFEGNPRFSFVRADVADRPAVDRAFTEAEPGVVFHLAAESHVDRSIDGPEEFMRSNIMGTFTLLEAARAYWKNLAPSKQKAFRFLHISTDEVFGSLGPSGLFTESTPYDPSSPYSASKAASDHLVRAWFRTYGLPTIVTNCSNNYGPRQFPEKLIPLVILNALEGKPLPVYGKGDNVRDWLFVEDHARALVLAVEKGAPGETYNVGGASERANLDVVKGICRLLDEMRPHQSVRNRCELIKFVPDRPGHDKRYAIDGSKIGRELGWRPEETFETGLRRTVRWYLDNPDWWGRVRSGGYRGQRLGLGKEG